LWKGKEGDIGARGGRVIPCRLGDGVNECSGIKRKDSESKRESGGRGTSKERNIKGPTLVYV